MKMRLPLAVVFALTLAGSLSAQIPAGLAKYRSAENTNYWGNRKPNGSYWQQDVYYNINAEVIPDSNLVTGTLTLTYYNNSPDTLKEVFFHLYQNAFQPDSYNDKRSKEAGYERRYGPYEQQKKGAVIHSLKQENANISPELDNTIARVKLVRPLLPNTFTSFEIKFSTWWDTESEGRRMKAMFSDVKDAAGQVYKVKHLDGVHWYPRICVYDNKKAWDTEQHLGYEFYGDFGAYDVNLTFPGHYVLDATGVIQNPDEVMPAELRKKLDVKNFKEKPWGEAASEIIPPANSGKKTWRYSALNVHDFAFTADPTYRIGEAEWEGIKCISLAREAHASGWQDAAEFTAKIIKTYSEDIGRYLYPKMIVADADDGMEYPMLTLDGGRSPGYYGLLAHEVGHNWFFGMVGNNETYRAMLDEGFTQFLTAWCMNKLRGPGEVPLGQVNPTIFGNAMAGYLWQAYLGYDGVITTNSNAFPDHQNYRMVYSKTSTMLYNLQYVLGEEMFLAAMKHYFSKWKLAHPYDHDFRDAITEYCNCDLAWFFDQWLDTDKVIDYSVKCVKTSEGGHKVVVTFERQGEMQMPLDFMVVTAEGDSLLYTVPNTWYAKSKPGMTVLPKWTGYERVNPTYTAELSLPGKFKKIIIDPSYRLADIDLLDNVSGCMPMKMKFRITPSPQAWRFDWTHYKWELRPNLWWNAQSGIQIGISANGNYMRTTGKTYLGIWYNSGLLQLEDASGAEPPFDDIRVFSWKYNYSTPVRRFGPGASLGIHSTWRDGLHRHGVTVVKKFAKAADENPRSVTFKAGYDFLYRPDFSDANYLIYPERWVTGATNAWVFGTVESRYPFPGGNGLVKATLRSSAPGSDSRYGWGRAEAYHNISLKKLLLRTRVFAQYGDGNIPMESKLYLDGGSPEDMFENEFYRARGFFPNSFTDNNLGRETSHLHFGGGLNLRGYTGYLAEYEDGSPAWYGNSGGSVNAELEYGRLINWHPRKLSRVLRLHSYLFADGGMIARSTAAAGFDLPEFSSFRMDAGIGWALDISQKNFFQEQPLTIRFDLPLWLSRPPAMEEFFQARWVLGIGRAF